MGVSDGVVERDGVCSGVLLSERVDGDDGVPGRVLLQCDGHEQPGGVRGGVRVRSGSEQRGGVWSGDVLSERGDVGCVGVSCRDVLRGGHRGAAGMSRRQLLSGGVVVADGVSGGQLLWRQLGIADGVRGGQLLCGGVVGGEGVRGRILLSERVGGAGVQCGVVVPDWERERGGV